MVIRDVHCGDQGGYILTRKVQWQSGRVHCGDQGGYRGNQGGYTVVIREGTY